MSEQAWQPSGLELRNGQEAYIHYLAGIAMLQNPDHEIALGLVGEAFQQEHADVGLVIRSAERLMYRGLQIVIANANPEDYRSPISKAEHRYDAAMPHIWHIVDTVCEQHESRLHRMNPAYTSIRPMPLADKNLYGYICHSRRAKIATIRLLNGFVPPHDIAALLKDRVLQQEDRHAGHESA